MRRAWIAALFLPGAAAAAPPILTPHGLAPAQIGMTVDQAEKALGEKLTIDAGSTDDPKLCVLASERSDGIDYLFERGTLARIGISQGAPAIRTAAGIGIGSPASAIRRTYKTAKISANAYDEEGEDFEVNYSGFALIFVTSKDRVVQIRAGRIPAVEYIEGCL